MVHPHIIQAQGSFHLKQEAVFLTVAVKQGNWRCGNNMAMGNTRQSRPSRHLMALPP